MIEGMHVAENLLWYATSIILVLYMIIGMFTFLGFYLIPAKKPEETEKKFISVIVPFRNEEKNLPALIESFKKLDYPRELHEFVFINDHSTDNGCSIIQHSGIPNGRLIHAAGEGKKSAIVEGVKEAKGTMIACTDADCMVPPKWLEFINRSKDALILGPVQLQPVNSFLKMFQEVELAALQSVSGSTANIKLPLLCNGANLAFKKSEFREQQLKSQTPSGDDIFLLEDFESRKLPIGFIWNNEFIVKTKPVSGWKELIAQKVRWASKSKYYGNKVNLVLGILIALMNIDLILCLISYLIAGTDFTPFVFISKLVIDDIIILPYLILIKKPWLVLLMGFFVMLYPFYFLWVLILSLRGKFTWKERAYHA